MNVLVTGGAGYLGSVLIPKLLIRGHKVRVLEIGYFGLGHLRNLRPAVEIVRGDIRRLLNDAAFAELLLNGIDCVMHLAAISNDPSADLHPELTEDINYRATVALAEAAKSRGIKLLFSSSCSVYGEADGQQDENGSVAPLTVYAASKVNSENALFAMADDKWRPVILRNGTLFGYSSKMRFDLVINIFSLYSTLYNEIRIFGDGQQWRPFLHVSDCARAFIFLAEKKDLREISYNVSNENLRVIDLAATFQRINPNVKVTYVPTLDPDRRNYSVTSARLMEEGFRPRIPVEVGAEEIVQAIIEGMIPDPESLFYRNAKWLKELTQVDSRDHLQLVDLMESFSSVRRGSH